MAKFDDIFIDCTSQGTKIPKDKYLITGKNIVIDQGQNVIAGYTNLEDGLFEDVPAIIFGDHTRIIKYVDHPFFLGADGVKLLKSKRKDANYKYLYYALKNAKIPDTGYNRHFKWLKEIEIEYPNAERQADIVKVLDNISSIITNRKAELEELEKLIKARFVEMFGDPKKNNKNLVSIGSIGHLNSGGTPSRGKPEYFQGNIKWFTAGELNSLYLGDTIEHISEDGLKNSSAKLFKKGTLMIGMYDTAAFKMGILTEDSASNQACANLEPNDNYDVIWLYYVFSILKPLYLNERQGVRQQNLSLTKIKNLQFPAAPFDKQKKFADFVREVDKSKVAVQKSLDETQLLFNSLMQKYFG